MKALRLERRRVAQERKQEAQQKELLWQQLKFETDERAEIDREHGNMVAAMQKELTYAEHAKGAFQAQVFPLAPAPARLTHFLCPQRQGTGLDSAHRGTVSALYSAADSSNER